MKLSINEPGISQESKEGCKGKESLYDKKLVLLTQI